MIFGYGKTTGTLPERQTSFSIAKLSNPNRRRLKLSMIICFKNTSKHGLRVQAAVEEVYAKESIVVCHSLKDALLIPKRPIVLNDIFVLLAEDQQELSTLSGYVSQLLEHNLILVLPDKGVNNLLAGCDYQPKYMADMNGDFKDIQEVIKKIFQPHRPLY